MNGYIDNLTYTTLEDTEDGISADYFIIDYIDQNGNVYCIEGDDASPLTTWVMAYLYVNVPEGFPFLQNIINRMFDPFEQNVTEDLAKILPNLPVHHIHYDT